jgi:hypothetical protein
MPIRENGKKGHVSRRDVALLIVSKSNLTAPPRTWGAFDH